MSKIEGNGVLLAFVEGRLKKLRLGRRGSMVVVVITTLYAKTHRP